MKNTEKPYNLKITNGRAVLTMRNKGADGRIHSATCEYPLYTEVENQETHKMEIKKQTKKQVENYLFNAVLGA